MKQIDIDYIFKELKTKKYNPDKLNSTDKNILFMIGRNISYSLPKATSVLRASINNKKIAFNEMKNKELDLKTMANLDRALAFYLWR